MGKAIYIAYGSNLNIVQMAYRCKTAKVLGSAMLSGYRLFFRGSDNYYATIEKYKGGKVPVLIWEIEAADEAALNRYEGYPVFYRKENIKIRFKSKWIEAMVYVMNGGRPLGCPSGYYYNIILEGYKAAGFDIDILDEAVRMSAGKELYNYG